jgi:diguanylate cyclase (GGDEF)-like protein
VANRRYLVDHITSIGIIVADLITNIVLLILVIILAILLIQRQRQLNKARLPANLEEVLEKLIQNLLSSRTEGKIQKVASHLSDILINDLQANRILFFRKQRRFMEMNYVYGLKNIQRARYRIRLSDDLMKRLTEGQLLCHPHDLGQLLNHDLTELLEKEQFNLVFPIFWMDNLFGVYFISTQLTVDHPILKTFLLFLNQNLSVAYQITRLESAQRILENKVESEMKKNRRLEEKKAESDSKEMEDDPGHLIEMFGHRKVNDLVAGLFDRVRAGLKAEKLLFVSRPGAEGAGDLNFMLGIQKEDFSLNGKEFQDVFGKLQKSQIYDVSQLRDIDGSDRLAGHLEREKINHLSIFSLSDTEQGLLFWAGRDRDEKAEYRLLARLEHVARRALVNAREFERVEEMSYTDSLTGLYNHRYFVKRLGEEIQRAKRYDRTVGLLLFDIDDFKLYNDNFGHLWGDELLRRMGKTLAQSLRAIDIVARYGGDEFGIIMPEADMATCGIFMDRLRYAISGTDFRNQVDEFKGQITISIGSAISPDDAEDAKGLFECADKALFKSKEMGRNRSTVYDAGLLEHDSSL